MSQVFLIQSKKVAASNSFGNRSISSSDKTHDAETLSWVIENESRAGKLTDTFPGSKFLCIPIGTNVSFVGEADRNHTFDWICANGNTQKFTARKGIG
jgi:K+-sensing histidine kinase KdpD